MELPRVARLEGPVPTCPWCLVEIPDRPTDPYTTLRCLACQQLVECRLRPGTMHFITEPVDLWS